MIKEKQAAIVNPVEDALETEDDDRLTDSIKIDFSAIPDHVREDLAAATFECVRSFLQQPGGREFLEAKKGSEESCKVKTKGALTIERSIRVVVIEPDKPARITEIVCAGINASSSRRIYPSHSRLRHSWRESSQSRADTRT